MKKIRNMSATREIGRSISIVLLAGLFVMMTTDLVRAQVSSRLSIRAISANVIVPQARVTSLAVDRTKKVEVSGVEVGVVILEQTATTTIDIALKNPTGSRLEAELLVPVPEGATIRGFDFQGAGKEPSAELLPLDEAKETYEAIVAKIKDPALLEFAGYNLIRSSVFPVEAHGTQKIRLTYESILPADGDRIDYMLPRSESIDYGAPWTATVSIKSKQPISTVYSPSHEINVKKQGKFAATIKLDEATMKEPGPLQISYLRDTGKGVTASLIAYPDSKTDGGYFLLLAGLPSKDDKAQEEIPDVKREVTIVIDRSGSMAGEKIEQAKKAALQVLDGLRRGEAFNIVDYSDWISSFASKPVVKTKENEEAARHYIRRLQSGGGTNIHDSLLEALKPEPIEGMLPIVLFLTDGLPTVGVRNEVEIREAAKKNNEHNRRIFTFGVGYDVNTPLLRNIALRSRAISTFVLPNEEIETKVSQVYHRLFGPVLSSPELKLVGEDTNRARLRDLMPRELPDMFEGDQLVLLGKYEGDRPLEFELKGDFRGKDRTFRFKFKLDSATTRNSFVPRLWASRKIAKLIDEIRQAGAESGIGSSVVAASESTDPRMKELVDEIVKLSIKHGILTEYTAFLAREGTDLNGRSEILRQANFNLQNRAVATRSGVGSFNQAANFNFQQTQQRLNPTNAFYDQNMNRVQISRVQQVNDQTFFQRGNRWIDAQAVAEGQADQADRTITIGSPEFLELAQRLAAENRQGSLSMSGEILLRVDGRNVLIRGK